MVGVVVEIRPAGGAAVYAGHAADQVQVHFDLLVWGQVAPVEDDLAGAAQLPGADETRLLVVVPQPGHVLELLHVFGQRQAGGQAEDGHGHSLPLAALVLDEGTELHLLAFRGLGLIEARLQTDRAFLGAGRLERLIGIGDRVGEDVLATDLQPHFVLAGFQELFRLGHVEHQSVLSAGREIELHVLTADLHGDRAGLGGLLVGLGESDQGLEGENGGLRGAEAAVAAALLADPLD